jgi:hypothetical protein
MLVMASSVRTRTAVITRIEALARHAHSIEAACQRDALKLKARDVQESLREARSWLEGDRRPQPVLVTHVARMVDDASQQLYALLRQIE